MESIATSVHGQPPRVTLKALLEAGVHFGHQAKRWNPKMKPYIFAERNGIHIIDLQQTVPLLAAAHDFVVDATSRGGKILFVGTKKQAQDVVEREAKRSGQYYVNRRWLGGTLTNFVTIRNRLRYMKQLQAELARGAFDLLPKQEAAGKMAELERLERTLGGMRDMTQLPRRFSSSIPSVNNWRCTRRVALGFPSLPSPTRTATRMMRTFSSRPTMTLSARSGSSRRELRTRRSKGRRVTKLPRRTAKCRPNRDIRTSPSCSEATTS